MNEIKEVDTTLSTEGTEWHGKAMHVPCIDRALLEEENILFRLFKSPVVSFMGEVVKESDRWLLWTKDKDDTPIPISEHTKEYMVITPDEIFSQIEGQLNGSGFRLSTAGTLSGKRKLYFSLERDYDGCVHPYGAASRTFINVTSSFDASTPLTAGASNRKVVCGNTFNLFLMSGGDKHKVVHRIGNERKVLDFAEVIENLLSQEGIMKEFLAEMSGEDISKYASEAGLVAASAIIPDLSARSSMMKKNRASLIVRSVEKAAESGHGNRGETLLDAFNGVTDFFSNSPYARSLDQFDSEKRDFTTRLMIKSLVERDRISSEVWDRRVFDTMEALA
jgi:hypothetical protein